MSTNAKRPGLSPGSLLSRPQLRDHTNAKSCEVICAPFENVRKSCVRWSPEVTSQTVALTWCSDAPGAIAAELDRVASSVAIALEVSDGVAIGLTALEHERVVARAAVEVVGSAAALERVVARAAIERICAVTAALMIALKTATPTSDDLRNRCARA